MMAMRLYTEAQFMQAVLAVIDNDEYLRKAHDGLNPTTKRNLVAAFGNQFPLHGEEPKPAPPPRKKKALAKKRLVDIL